METTCGPQDIAGHQRLGCGHTFAGTYGQMSQDMLAHANPPKVRFTNPNA